MLKIIFLAGFVSVVWSKGYPTYKTSVAGEYGLIDEDALKNRGPLHQTQVAVEYDDDENKKYDLHVDDKPQPELYEQKSIDVFPKRSKESRSSKKPGEKQGNYKGSDSIEEVSQKKLSYHAAKVSQEKVEVKSLTRNYASQLPSEPKNQYNAYKSERYIPSRSLSNQKPIEIDYSSHIGQNNYPHQNYDDQEMQSKTSHYPKGGDISTQKQYVDVNFKRHSEFTKGGAIKHGLPQHHQYVSYETGMRPGKYGSSGENKGHSMYTINKGDYKKIMLNNAKYPSPLPQTQPGYLEEPKFYTENPRGNLGIAAQRGSGAQYGYQDLGSSGLPADHSKGRAVNSGLKSYSSSSSIGSYSHGAKSNGGLGHQGTAAFTYYNSLGGSGMEYEGIGGTAGIKYDSTVAVNPKYGHSHDTRGSKNYHDFKNSKSSLSHGISGSKGLGPYGSEGGSRQHYEGTGSNRPGNHFTNSGAKHHDGMRGFGTHGASTYRVIKNGNDAGSYGIGNSGSSTYGKIGNTGGSAFVQSSYGIGSQGTKQSYGEIFRNHGIDGAGYLAGTSGYLGGGSASDAGLNLKNSGHIVNSGYHKTDKNAQTSSYSHQGSIKSTGGKHHGIRYPGSSKEYQGIGGLNHGGNKYQQKSGGASVHYVSGPSGTSTGKGSGIVSDHHTKNRYPIKEERSHLDIKEYRPSYQPQLHQVEQKKIPSYQSKTHSIGAPSSVQSVKGNGNNEGSEYQGIGEVKYEPESKVGNGYSPSYPKSTGKGQSVKVVHPNHGVKGGSKPEYNGYSGKKPHGQYLPITAVNSGIASGKPSTSQYPDTSDKLPETEQKELVYEAFLGGPGTGNQAQGSGGYGFHPTGDAASPSSGAAGYDEDHKDSQPMPYEFSYKINDDEHDAEHYRQEKMDDSGYLTGSYGYKDAHGIYRHVDYQASKDGFKANVRTNEPGTDNQDPADVHFEVEKSSSSY